MHYTHFAQTDDCNLGVFPAQYLAPERLSVEESLSRAPIDKRPYAFFKRKLRIVTKHSLGFVCVGARVFRALSISRQFIW
jgi:hypothetical protein